MDGTSRAPSLPANALSAGVAKRAEKERRGEAHSQGAETGAFSSGVDAPSPAADKRTYDAGEDLVGRYARLFAQSFPPTPTRGPRITPEAWLASTRPKGKDTEINRGIALAQKNVTAALAPKSGCGSSGWQPMAGDDIGSGTKPAETK